ncbi:Arabinose efflux permease [Geoglobus ahangari]|uniref:Arabinose efflux permease n=1 Tax=Geoglobus ahangari TaxID=113653 RepID=A0A0F7DC14_9EURY|nr:Arabinose efflux permease [Geoglobus ahangari]
MIPGYLVTIEGEKRGGLLFTASLVLFTLTIGVGIISPILPVIAENMGAAGVTIGLIFSAFSLSRLAFLPLFGHLSDRYGRRPMIVTGLSLYAILALLYGAARTPEQLIAVRLFHGMSSAMVMPVILAMVASASPQGQEGRYMGIANRSIFLGMSFGPLIGGALSDAFSFRLAFASMSLMSLVSLILVILNLPEVGSPERRERRRGTFNRNVIFAIIYRVLNSTGRGSVMTFLPVYGYLIGLSYTQIGLLIFTNLLVSGILQPYAGVFSDRRGFVLPVVASTVMSALILYAIPMTDKFVLLAILTTLLGFTSALALPAVSGLIAVEGKESGNLGGLMGYFSASKSLGRAVGPLIAGALYDLGGGGHEGIYLAFSVSAILTVLAGLLFWAGVRDSHQIIEME